MAARATKHSLAEAVTCQSRGSAGGSLGITLASEKHVALMACRWAPHVLVFVLLVSHVPMLAALNSTYFNTGLRQSIIQAGVHTHHAVEGEPSQDAPVRFYMYEDPAFYDPECVVSLVFARKVLEEPMSQYYAEIAAYR